MSSRAHIYNNPNFATVKSQQISIGGMPFYLIPANDMVAAGAVSPEHSSERIGSPVTITSPQKQQDFNLVLKDNIPRSAPTQRRQHRQTLPRDNDDGSFYGGPIYEDIDRNCSYRGAPPFHEEPTARNYYNIKDLNSTSQQSSSTSSPFNSVVSNEFRTAQARRPLSYEETGKTKQNTSSSSETSYEDRNITVNPLCSPMTRFPRNFQKANNNSESTSSIYYYSDTLRKRPGDDTNRNLRHPHLLNTRAIVDSDSGISVMDTPSPHRHLTGLRPVQSPSQDKQAVVQLRRPIQSFEMKDRASVRLSE